MARFSAGVRTAAGSTTLPIFSLYAGATGGGRLRELGVENTGAVAVALYLARFTTTGTQGAGLVEAKHDPNSGPALCTAVTTHTVLPTLGDDLGYRATLGAAVGSAYAWTFWDGPGLVIPVGTANGVGLLVATGAGVVCDCYAIWDE